MNWGCLTCLGVYHEQESNRAQIIYEAPHTNTDWQQPSVLHLFLNQKTLADVSLNFQASISKIADGMTRNWAFSAVLEWLVWSEVLSFLLDVICEFQQLTRLYSSFGFNEFVKQALFGKKSYK